MNATLSVRRPEEMRLESQVAGRLGRRVRDFQVVQHAHGLILKGRTATYHVKQLAQHATMEFSDLPILANDIEVQ
ncbi:MAG: hypothetical protein K2X38_11025 [Gemmataceae bacterium]|nr:hypothetical protein [Gemmataceae bacterium]